MTKDEAERAKRLEKLQSTLHAVQMPQADQQLVGYHRERRPLAEEELDQASVSGLIPAGSKEFLELLSGVRRLPVKEAMILSEEHKAVLQCPVGSGNDAALEQ